MKIIMSFFYPNHLHFYLITRDFLIRRLVGQTPRDRLPGTDSQGQTPRDRLPGVLSNTSVVNDFKFIHDVLCTYG